MLKTLTSQMKQRAFSALHVAVPNCVLRAPEPFGGRHVAGCRVGRPVIKDGALIGLHDDAAPAQVLVLPRLTEPHVHLDKCHTLERMGDVGGDLAAAAAVQLRDKTLCTRDDLDHRMRRGLRELSEAGCGTVRTHIDWSTPADETPLAWDVACDLRASARELGIDMQVAALTGIDEMADPAAADAVAARVAQDNGVLGAFVLNHQNRERGLRALFERADRFGLALDFHVDEGLDPNLNGLELICQVAQDTGFQGPVLCGHACSLASQSKDDVARIADRLAQTGISIVSLPTTNLYLQGRSGGTPKPRGLTMIHELRAAGVVVALGSDNVRDAFCPVGQHDPINSLSLAVLAAHLDPPLADHLPLITTDAQSALGEPCRMVDGLPLDELILFDAPDVSTVLSTRPKPLSLSPFVIGDTAHG